MRSRSSATRPHQLVEEALAKAYPEGMAVPDAMSACVRFPWRAVVTTAFDDLWDRAFDATTGVRRPPAILTAGDDPARAGDRTAAASPRRSGRACPRASAWAPATRASGWCRRPALAWLAHMARRRVRVRRLPPHRSGPGLAVVVAGDAAARGAALPVSRRLGRPGRRHRSVGLGAAHRLRGDPVPGRDRRGRRRLATIATSIAAQLPPLDTDIDVGIWLEKWAQDPGNPSRARCWRGSKPPCARTSAGTA